MTSLWWMKLFLLRTICLNPQGILKNHAEHYMAIERWIINSKSCQKSSYTFCILSCQVKVRKGLIIPGSSLRLNSDKYSILKKSLFCLFDYWSRQALAVVSCHLHLIKAMTLGDPSDPYLSEEVKSDTLIVVERAAPAAFREALGNAISDRFQV